MKPHLASATLALGLVLSFTALASTQAQSSFTDIDVSNDATIAGAAFFGNIQLGNYEGLGMGTAHGMSLHVTQASTQEVFSSYTQPGYWMDNWVTVDIWDFVQEAGHYEPQYEWGIEGYDHFPEVVDLDGNVTQPESWEPRYGNIYVGDTWVDGAVVWGIAGTTTENQATWVEEQTMTYSELRYDAPVIHETATRSDANWVWDIPDGDGGVRNVMRVWDGGLALHETSGNVNMALTPTSLVYIRNGTVAGASSSNTNANIDAQATTYITTSTTTGVQTTKTGEYAPASLRLTHQQSGGGVATTTDQTQITAKSASFGGVVTVQGDLKVQGALRVLPRGDISMGEFASGPQP